MSTYLAALNLNLSTGSRSAKHRQAVFESTPWAPDPTTRVSYVAANRLLIIAGPDIAAGIAAKLPGKLLCYNAIPSPQSGASANADAYHCAGLSVRGYLGRFRVMIDCHDDKRAGGDPGDNLADLLKIQSGFFDQVLDCGAEPLISAAVKPPGYHHARPGEESLETAIAAIPGRIGEFEKPKYFDYNPDICAHGRSGVSGCNRCLEACPSDAILSLADTVEVNPHLCMGYGACASSCPTGAIGYVYPGAAEQIEVLRVMLKALRLKNRNRGVTLLIFDNENGRPSVEAVSARFGGHIVPFAVEEIGSAGLDLIASAMAYGANRVCLYVPGQVPAQVTATVRRDLAVIAAVLQQTGCHTHRAEIIDDLGALDAHQPPESIEQASTFAPAGDKRATIRAALSFFSEISPCPPPAAGLPAGSLFGRIRLDAEACTLCMGCVSVCPAGALQAGGDTPALKFIESNCVQCGICANACPETAVTLESRLHFDLSFANTPRALKEEAPFRCIQCAKPFATQSMITRMTEKLKGHWMFEKPESLRRLQMCEDCRVKDLLDRETRLSE